MKILVAEDSPDVAEAVAFATRMNWPGCEVLLAASGTEALRLFTEHHVDLAILDVSIPAPDGFELCRHIRERAEIPILMLTIRSRTVDKVRALDLGADDYLTKPFDPLELLARLRALMRRTSRAFASSGPRLTLDELVLDFGRHEIYVAGIPVHLTPTEYSLLEVLARHAGQLLSHSFLLETVWGEEYARESHYLKVYIRRLRQKLGDEAEDARYIETVRGVGYRFTPLVNPPFGS